MNAPVVDANEVAAVAAALAGSSIAAFDLEFLSQDRLIPTLCLIQVAWLPEHVRLDAPAADIVAMVPEIRVIDPMAVDVRPIIEALAGHPIVLAHAPRQDLALLFNRFALEMPHVVDTQLMAAFAGIGDQVGLATLANELLRTSLGKELQWTDWAKRPLSDAQLAYAASDVRYLFAIYALLAARLGERLSWVRAESTLVAADAVAAAKVTPESAWRNVGGLRGLDAPTLAAVIELASWRQRTAIELDRPLGQVLNDKVLQDLARHRPRDASSIRSIKGLSPLARQRADELVAALAAARPDQAPVIAAGRAPSARAQRWAELLLALVQLIADRSGVAARLLATRSDAEEFARVVDEKGLDAAAALPALATWRHDVIGKPWVDWLTGKLALVGDLATVQGLGTVSTISTL